MLRHCENIHRAAHVVNLDPAAEYFDYQPVAGMSCFELGGLGIYKTAGLVAHKRDMGKIPQRAKIDLNSKSIVVAKGSVMTQ